MSDDYKQLNLNKIKSKENIIISSKDSLKDVIPINWSGKVIAGDKKITIG